jgi:ATP-dependent Clp endopeptidase proteolytic subunit ClpP
MKIIQIHNTIDNDSFLGMGEHGYISKKVDEFNEDLEEPILLSLNTPGGYVYDGYNLLGAMDDHKGKITAVVEGLAASMGAYFMAYADEAKARSFARIMLHKAYNPYIDYIEDEKEKEIMQEQLNVMNQNLAKAFKTRGANPALIDQIFSDENNLDFWFSAEEALENGLIDEIIGSAGHGDAVKIAAMEKETEQFKVYWNNNPKFYKKDEETMGIFNKEEILSKVNDFESALGGLGDKVTEMSETLASVNEKLNSISEMQNKVDELQKIVDETKESVADDKKAFELSVKTIAEDLESHAEATKETVEAVQNDIETVKNEVKESLEGLQTNFTPDENPEIETDPYKEIVEINKKNDRRNR